LHSVDPLQEEPYGLAQTFSDGRSPIGYRQEAAMKRLMIAIAVVSGVALTMGVDSAWAQRSGGGHSGGSHSRGGGGSSSHGYGGHVSRPSAHYGGHYRGHYGGGYYGYRGWYGPGIGIYYGSPWYWGWPWYAGAYPYYPYYPYGAYSVYDAPPTVYVEQSPAASGDEAPSAPANLWYYCTDPAGYYPYVQNCRAPWVKVVPPPASAATPSGSISPGPATPAWQIAPSGQSGK
jgi:hypothetical protein